MLQLVYGKPDTYKKSKPSHTDDDNTPQFLTGYPNTLNVGPKVEGQVDNLSQDIEDYWSQKFKNMEDQLDSVSGKVDEVKEE